MPLSKGKSEKAFKKNVKTEYEEGKPLKQSLAIAYSMKRKAGKKKMAEGGSVGPIEPQLTDNYQSPCSSKCNHPGQPHPQEGGYQDHEGDNKKPNGPAMSEADRKLGQHGAQEVGPEGHEGHMAHGGGVHERPNEDAEDKGESKAGEHVRLTDKNEPYNKYNKEHLDKAKAEHYRVLGELKADRRDRKFMAAGGYADGGDVMPPKGTYNSDYTSKVNPEAMAKGSQANNEQEDQADRHDMQGRPMAEGGQITDNYADTEDGDGRDMVGRIMAQYRKQYSKGGQVANQEHGKDNNELSGFSPNEFDDLVLRDDDMETADYTGANSGDEKGSAGEDERRRDMVSRIMKSRKKKDRLPDPA